mmetsp:Transcript_79199/g.190069  ORF Transcript_79199/g.190069 Transcript_79199/m.190069 type:complete len:396 (-) Transcript_79199:649-1836(-)
MFQSELPRAVAEPFAPGCFLGLRSLCAVLHLHAESRLLHQAKACRWLGALRGGAEGGSEAPAHRAEDVSSAGSGVGPGLWAGLHVLLRPLVQQAGDLVRLERGGHHLGPHLPGDGSRAIAAPHVAKRLRQDGAAGSQERLGQGICFGRFECLDSGGAVPGRPAAIGAKIHRPGRGLRPADAHGPVFAGLAEAVELDGDLPEVGSLLLLVAAGVSGLQVHLRLPLLAELLSHRCGSTASFSRRHGLPGRGGHVHGAHCPGNRRVPFLRRRVRSTEHCAGLKLAGGHRSGSSRQRGGQTPRLRGPVSDRLCGGQVGACPAPGGGGQGPHSRHGDDPEPEGLLPGQGVHSSCRAGLAHQRALWHFEAEHSADASGHSTSDPGEYHPAGGGRRFACPTG